MELNELLKTFDVIERICAAVADELQAQGLTDLRSTEMEQQAYTLNDTITDPDIRNLHILQGV